MLNIRKFKQNYKIFKGFRLINEAYSNMILTWRNSDHVRIYMNNPNFIDKESHQKWLKRVIISETDLYFIYELNKNPVGLVCFNYIDENNSAAEWGFYLGEQNLPKGAGTKMLSNAILLTTDKIKLSRIYANVIPSNGKGHYMHLKLGFKQKGDLLILELK